MIILNLEDFSWGTSPIPDFPDAVRLNYMDPDSKLRFTMVWNGEPLVQLITELSAGLTEEQVAAVIEHLQNRDTAVEGEVVAEEQEQEQT